MLLEIFFFAAGLALLVKGADWLVDHSAHLARTIGISPLIIGLTVVAFGTSLPEMVVSTFAAVKGSADISIGNIVGSNIANIGLILGISALIRVLPIQLSTLIYEMPFLLVSAFLLMLLSNDRNLFLHESFTLSRIDGLILLAMFGLFLLYIIRNAREQQQEAAVKKEYGKKYGKKHLLWKDIALIGAGLTALIIGGRIVVDNAVKIALGLGISEAFIGLTIIAVGTSLPELMTSLVAAYKKQADIAVGNIVGSNIFNILLILGVSSLIAPLTVNPIMLFVDMTIMVLFSIALLAFVTTGRRITRGEGAVLLLGYVAYIGYLIYTI
ncbi:calcium/sodium antiporter [Candidatus Woesearchaeota archaeon]|nr:calcium/sodium antiporter [Candidatus Woesearchaeota archaeon]